jgi:hypothetical protein
MISYDKNLLSNDLVSSYGLCRSLILNCENQLVSFAPPKSIPSDSFIQQYSLTNSSVVVEELIEGTMIQMFWDPALGLSGSWEISTRNTLGATSCFFKGPNQKTFRTMFLEACTENGVSWEQLNKKLVYSFVLQHPENRIVVPFSKAQLYLVGLYQIENNQANKEIHVYQYEVDTADYLGLGLGLQNTRVRFPEKYVGMNDYSQVIEKYASMNTPYHILGVVVYHKSTGERMKIRNPVYEQVRQLRGNQPKLQYQYLHLRHEGKVAEFLQFFSEKKSEFSEFRDQVHLFTHTLFSNYLSCYIKKEKPLIEYLEQYRIHMFHLHRIYLNELRDKKLFITNKIVKKYVNEMHPSLLMYTLNYPLRKQSIDIMAATA